VRLEKKKGGSNAEGEDTNRQKIILTGKKKDGSVGGGRMVGEKISVLMEFACRKVES